MAPPAYYMDADKSRAELLRLVDAMVAGSRITANDGAVARADIEGAYATADSASWFGADAETFWSDLAARVNANVGKYAAWGSGVAGKSGLSPGKAYGETVLSGFTAFNSAKATEYANSWAAFYQDVVVQSAEDLLQGLKDTKDKLENPWWIGAAAVLVVGIIILQGRR